MIALDLFAGTGWGVACQRLGIEEYGVEIMPEAIATRAANGMHTAYLDVWDGLLGEPFLDDLIGTYDLLIASPPCQTFSAAGSGTGRKALDEVLGLIDLGAYGDPDGLCRFGERHDPRTALVLTPLAQAFRDLPRLVVWEQVPPVLPVWERAAEEMRKWGYSVVTGILNAEQYGVPQTRKRAILIARWDGEARMPTPTHSRYYPRDPSRLDPGVLPWVSMAEALGWGDDDATIERHRGAGMLERHGERRGRPVAEPALTVTGNASGTTPGGFRVMRSNYNTRAGKRAGERGERDEAQPAPTVTSKADRNKWHGRPATTVAGDPRIAAPGHHERQMNNATRVTIDEAAALQSYPPGFTFSGTKGKQFLQVGNAVPPRLAEAILSTLLD